VHVRLKYPHGAWHHQERKNTKTYGHITSYKKKGRSGHELISTLPSSFARHSPIAVSSFPIGSIFSSSNNAIYRTNNETAYEIYSRPEYCITNICCHCSIERTYGIAIANYSLKQCVRSRLNWDKFMKHSCKR
jgi:hypothetical protein